MKAPAPFFVYELVDPRDGEPFYVGKGQGNRPTDHFKEAAKGLNSHKCNKIRAIQASGAEVCINIVKRFRNEDAAYRFEEKHIKRLGLENLTNICPGGRGNVTTDPDIEAVDLLAKCARKTEGFTIRPRLRFGDEIFEVGDVLFKIAGQLFRKIEKSRGEQWLIEKLAARNIILIPIEKQAGNNAL